MTTTAAPKRFTVMAFRMKSSSPSLREIELTMHFPWQHFKPASMTLKLDESIQSGTYLCVNSKKVSIS